MPGPNYPTNYSQLDQQQILQHVFDEATDKLRVDASISVTTVIGEVSVELDAADGDNVAIKDPSTGNTLSINSDGSINTVSTSVGVKTPTITNINVTVANFENTITFLPSVKKFLLKNRGNARMQISFTAGQSGTNFLTIWPGTVYEIDNLVLNSSLNVYYQASKASIIEVLSWS